MWLPLLLSLLACSTPDLRDSSIPAKWLPGVETDIEKNPNNPEGYFYRARIYSNNCQSNPRKYLKFCVYDTTKAIELVGSDNAPFQYLALRGYCNAARILGCEWDMPPQYSLNFETDARVMRSDEDRDIMSDAVMDMYVASRKPPARGMPTEESGETGYRATLEAAAMLDLHNRNFVSAKYFFDMLLSKSPHPGPHRLFHSDDFNRDARGEYYKLIFKTEKAVLREARQKNAPNLQELQASYAVAKERVSQYQQELDTRNNDRLAAESWARAEAERRKAIEQGKKDAEFAEKYPGHVTCARCKGTGKTTYTDYGDIERCVPETNGYARCSRARSSSERTMVCPVCGGLGHVHRSKNQDYK